MAPGFKGAVTSLRTIFLLWYLHINEAQSSTGCIHERVILTSKTGTITVGNSDPKYNNFARCEWLIKGKVYSGVKNTEISVINKNKPNCCNSCKLGNIIYIVTSIIETNGKNLHKILNTLL